MSDPLALIWFSWLDCPKDMSVVDIFMPRQHWIRKRRPAREPDTPLIYIRSV
ncbi:MAG: hypothetical protein AB2L14_27655 [Candidatus Xenobiia bacterium LiM19]